MEMRSAKLSFAIAAILLAAGAAEAQQASNPADWTCSKCPFDGGYRSSMELGGGYLNDSSAKFGDYTGLDQNGGYVVANAEGKASYADGYTLSYDLLNLGLDSREARIDGGKQGSFDFSLFYDRVPHHIYDDAQTIFSGLGSTSLTLPGGWVPATGTAGMTALSSSLRTVDVGYDHDRYGAAGSVWWGNNLVFSLDYRRDERSGTRPTYGSFGSVSTQLLQPIDDSTDRLDATARYETSRWFAQVAYYGSIYNTQAAALRWQNPYDSTFSGAVENEMALAPDNKYNEISISAGMHGLPWNTVVAFSAATGEGTQDVNFQGYTVNPTIATDPLPIRNLNGKVKVNRADLTLSMRPIDRLRLRGAVIYDERKNESDQAVFTSIVHTDLLPVGEDRENPVYGYQRFRANGSADYDVYSDLTVGVGGEYRTLDRKGTPLEVKSEKTENGWGRVQYRPSGYLGFVVKGGTDRREPDKYDTNVAAGYGQNPLMRKYDQAYRYRMYGDFLVNVAVGNLPLTLNGNAFYADDSYSRSELGLISGIDRRYGVDLTWAVNDKVSAYLSAGREKVASRRDGSTVFASADWRGNIEDDYETYGGGLRAAIAQDLTFHLDYNYGKGNSDTKIEGNSAGTFPKVTSKLNSMKADFTYGLTDRLDVIFTWWHETLNTEDWAIQGIEPATLPTVLALGVDPYNYSVNYVTASFRYYLGPRGVESK